MQRIDKMISIHKAATMEPNDLLIQNIIHILNLRKEAAKSAALTKSDPESNFNKEALQEFNIANFHLKEILAIPIEDTKINTQDQDQDQDSKLLPILLADLKNVQAEILKILNSDKINDQVYFELLTEEKIIKKYISTLEKM